MKTLKHNFRWDHNPCRRSAAVAASMLFMIVFIEAYYKVFVTGGWSGFRSIVNAPSLVVLSIFWIAGTIALWVKKTWYSSLIVFSAAIVTVVHGVLIRLGEGSRSYFGLIPLLAGFALLILGALDLKAKPEIDDPEVRPPSRDEKRRMDRAA